METAVDVTGNEPVANEAVIADQVTNETPVAEAPSMDDELRGIWDKRNPSRDEDGKFATKIDPKDVNATFKDIEKSLADHSAEKAQDQAKPAIEAPSSWSAEMKAKLSSLPPEYADVIKYAAQRDKDQGDAISRAGQQIKAYEPVRNVIEQFGSTFQKNGLQPHEGIARMMAVNEMLEQNPAAAIKEIARAYGVNLSGQAEQDASPENGRIAELEARLAKAESHLTAQERNRLNTENTALAREIADFAKDKPHFEAVRKVMAGLMSSGAAETMQDAYDRAVYADPTIRQALLADEATKVEAKRKEDEAKRVKDAKKAAGVNVRGSPGQSATVRTMDDDLREIARKHYGT